MLYSQTHHENIVVKMKIIFVKLASKISIFSKSVEIMNKSNEGMSGGNPTGIFLLAVILTPIFEEVVFRGIVFCAVEKVTNTFGAISITAIIFGVFYMNLAQLVFTMIMGIVAAIVYMKTRNIWVYNYFTLWK